MTDRNSGVPVLNAPKLQPEQLSSLAKNNTHNHTTHPFLCIFPPHFEVAQTKLRKLWCSADSEISWLLIAMKKLPARSLLLSLTRTQETHPQHPEIPPDSRALHRLTWLHWIAQTYILAMQAFYLLHSLGTATAIQCNWLKMLSVQSWAEFSTAWISLWTVPWKHIENDIPCFYLFLIKNQV